MSSADLQPLLLSITERLAAIEAHLGVSGPTGATAAAGVAELPRSIKAYDAYCNETIEPFVAVCNKLGGDAVAIGAAMKEAWQEQRQILLMASACKEPAQAALMPKLAGVTKSMKAVGALAKRNEWEKHCKAAAEGVQALNWLVVKPAPRDFIESYIGGSDYWANGIRKEFRGVNADQIAFCDSFKAILTGLMAYVKDHHLTGVTWNPKGGDAAAWTAEGAAAPIPAPAAPATQATAPPAAPAAAAAPKPAGASLFAELSKGGSITSGLKTVTKDQQTWRAEFKGGDAPAAATAAPKAKPVVTKRPVETVKGTPKVEFVPPQNKWSVQYQSASDCAAGPVEVRVAEKKESVYILGCLGAHIRVIGKCNGVVVDSCKRCTITFDTVMASLELVNCQRMHVVCNESASSFAIDKTDGCIITLPKTSLHSEIFASKSSEMNVQWYEGEGDEAELVEKPIPEQYVHRVNVATKSISANVSDLYSH